MGNNAINDKKCFALLSLVLQKANSYIHVMLVTWALDCIDSFPPIHICGSSLWVVLSYHDPTSRALSARCLIPSLLRKQLDTSSASLSSFLIMFKRINCQLLLRRFGVSPSGLSTSSVAVPLPCVDAFDPTLRS